MSNSLWLVTANLTSPVRELVASWQKKFDRWSNVRKLPPHVTIIPPWRGPQPIELLSQSGEKIESEIIGWCKYEAEGSGVIKIDVDSRPFLVLTEKIYRLSPTIPLRSANIPFHITVAKRIPAAKISEVWNRLSLCRLPTKNIQTSLNIYQYNDQVNKWQEIDNERVDRNVEKVGDN